MSGCALLLAVSLSPGFAPAPLRKTERVKGDLKNLQGTWAVVRVEFEGEELPWTDCRVVIEKDRWVLVRGGKNVSEMRIFLGTRQMPLTINFKEDHSAHLGIYRLDRDRLQVCYAARYWWDSLPPRFPPTRFTGKPSKHFLWVLKRIKP
jgi:uncharacterized protein (TIGR03067 family)